MITLSPHKRELLKVIVDAGDAGIAASAVGALLYANISSGRSRSTAAAQNALVLIHKGLVKRSRTRRKPYKYYATEEGIALEQSQ